MEAASILAFCFSLYLTISAIASAADSLNSTGSIKDGDSINSADGSFVLDFFSPGSSSKRYLGIRYGHISDPTYVWVANREEPIADTSGVLTLAADTGFLVLRNGSGSLLWSTNSSGTPRNPIAQLLDTGNLVVRNEGETNSENFLWQSFDYPSDSLMPGMKFGKDLVTGLDRYISTWKSPDDPARGDFTYGINSVGYPEFVVKRNDTTRFRAGPWNGVRLSGTPYLNPNPTYTYDFVFVPKKEAYYIYQLRNRSTITRLVINSIGLVQRYTWTAKTDGWQLYLTTELDNCDHYGFCGANGICNVNESPVCGCFDGFMPKNQHEWDLMDWTSGCVRRTEMNCSGDGFQKFSGIKLPETRTVWFDANTSLDECRRLCLKNCSCMAYTNMDIRDGSGCFQWFGNLIDMRELSQNGQDIYIRLAGSEIGQSHTVNKGAKSNKKRRIAIAVSSICIGCLLVGAILIYLWRKKRQRYKKMQENTPQDVTPKNESRSEDIDLPLFDFNTIACATDNFSHTNVLGEGGFGPVYKVATENGTLKDGQEIAVKRLSRESRQGDVEFKNEVRHIANLQHRNLVKLLGCCIQADEKMLIYEFMPNKSLDFFIFDKKCRLMLDWPMRFNIINGIARGLLYLHQDSRLRIIHRDLKASNILLDYEMNAKISDFGLARSFGGPETQANTNKVVGTYGYMSPEYAIDGLYSIKSDVFSFGVMVLEILSGRRNRGFSHPDHNLNLLGHAWTLYNEGRSLELVSGFLRDTWNEIEALRSVQIGLLCVQRSPDDRPTMSSVVFMLGGEGKLAEPKQPGFFTERELMDATSTSTNSKMYSANEVTVTLIEPR